MKKYFTFPVILFLWVLTVHIISVGNLYNMDDNYVVENNEQVTRGIVAIPEIFTSFYIQNEKATFYYRPIPKMLLAIEYEIFGNSPHVFHFIQVMLFVLLVLVIWLFFVRLLGQTYQKTIFWGLMLFIAFPTNTEIVTSLKNVDIILSGIFAFLALLIFLQGIDQKRWWLILMALPLLFLSTISKQDGLLYWIAGITGILILKNKKIRNLIVAAVFVLAVFGLYRIIIASLGEHGRVTRLYENPLFAIHSHFGRIPTGLGVIWFYFKMLLIPYPLSFYYGYKVLDVYQWTDWQVWISLIIIIGLLTIAIFQYRKNKLFTFFILGLLGSLFFYSNILFVPLAGIVGDRYLFMPAMFFVLIIAFLVFETNLSKKHLSKLKPALWILLIVYGIIALQRDHQWKDRTTLYSHDIKHLENSLKANELYATLVITNVNNSLKAGKNINLLRDSLKLAEKHFRQALKLDTTVYASLTNLGMINLLYHNNPRLAAEYFEKATHSAKDFVGPVEEERLYYYFGYSLMQIKEYQKAKQCFEHSCKIDSNNVMAYSLWSAAEIYTKNFKKAIEINQYLITKKLGRAQPYLNMGMCYFEMKKYNAGVKYFNQALVIDPENKVAKRHLANYYQSINKIDSARYYSRAGIKLFH